MSSSDSVVDSARLAYGAVVGAAAFILNYLVAFVLWSATSFPETYEGMGRELLTSQVADWVFAGWLVYGAHFVDVTASIGGIPGDPEFTLNAVDVVAQTTTDLLYITTPAVLIAAGIALARSHGVSSMRDGVITGATTAIGYFPLAAVGIFVFASEGNIGDAQPTFETALLLAGVAYPTVVGALGGAIATVID
jgi:hypothetical protein